VHGAKGLEAPIVILADTMTPPAGPKPPRLLPFDDGAMIWIGRKADDPPPVATARQNALAEATHEYRRLLYVAMTRAAERLIICGADGYNSRPAGCWYNLVRDALDPLLTAEDDNGDKVLRYRKPAAIPETPAPPSETKSSPRPAPPSWLRQTAPAIMLSAADLSPSSAFADEIIATAAPGLSAIARQKALARGRLCHRLLQSLPDIPPARRGEAAKRFLASAMDFSAAEQDDILRQVVAVLNAADFAPLFVPGSRAEVPIVGRLERAKDGPVFVSGQIDRLVVTDDMVLIADYKTDGVVPKQPQDAPEAYIAQLALYRAVLAKLYPDKRVRAALIFTAGPSLLALSGTMMDDSLARIMAQPAHAAAGMP
jgi:ATP-dependent helicase/nuclease subunit A